MPGGRTALGQRRAELTDWCRDRRGPGTLQTMSILDRVRARLNPDAPAPSGELAVSIDGQQFHFQSPSDLDLVLTPRTEVTAAVLREWGRLSEDELRADLALTRAVHKKLTHLILRAMETGVALAQVWREIDLSKIYEEHQWQALLYALSDPQQVGDDYRRAALVKYLQYLKARREVLQDLASERQRGQVHGPADHAPAVVSAGISPVVDDESFTAMKRSAEYSRLPPRHSVELVLTPGEPLTLFLAHRRMRLTVSEEGAVLSDDSGLSVPIREGRMVIGRSTDCDVILQGATGDVSRKHLMIEAGAQEVRLTDLSSHGTYVPKRALNNTQTRH